jgi:copper chaperone CopZ
MENQVFTSPIDKGIQMSEINLNVSGMTCGSCVKHVTNALKALDGVGDVCVDLATGKVKVSRSTDKSDDLIAALIEDGYPAQLVTGITTQAKPGGGCGGGCKCS